MVLVVAAREQRRQRDRDRSDLHRAEEGRDELKRVVQQQRDALLGLDAERTQGVARAVHGEGNICVGQGRAGGADRGAVAAAGRDM